MEWWFVLKRAPITERITIAKTEITMLHPSFISFCPFGDLGRGEGFRGGG